MPPNWPNLLVPGQLNSVFTKQMFYKRSFFLGGGYPAATGVLKARDGVKSLVDWKHEGKRSAAWEVREFERGVTQPKT